MIWHDVVHNTPGWFRLRLGNPTASEAAAVISKGRSGKPSKTRLAYMYLLAGERITGEPGSTFNGNRHTERGHILEPVAKEIAEFELCLDIEPGGYFQGELCGASPDGLIGIDGLAEVKTKLPKLMIDVLENGVPSEHIPQIQAQLWVAERDWCQFICYWPGLPIYTEKVYRDEAKIKSLADAYEVFCDELMELEYRIRSLEAA